ncbi:primosomal protein N' [Micromonospora sp. NBC_01412]
MTGTRRSDRRPADGSPVARVCVDVPLAHLDRPFDYLVPAELDGAAAPGTRVKVRFAGQLVDGWLLERADDSGHTGKLAYLEKVVSPEPVLAPEVARLARVVADRYAGSLADVLRLAVPPRHARVEKEPHTPPEPLAPLDPPEADGWRAYPAGPAFLRALAEGRPARAVWSALPGEDWPARYAEAVAATVAGGRGAVVVVPDARDLDRLDAALTVALGDGRHVVLAAAAGPARRYRAFLAARRGDVPVVIGTRAAMFAPVARLGLVAVVDDGDDLHAEPRAPYPHAREVLLTRAQLADAAALVGGYARSAEAQLLVETGWAREVVADRATVRARIPAVAPTGDDPQLARDPGAATARLPSLAWTAARDAVRADAPVLVQVPRRGYLPSISCAECRTPARCPHCAGPLALPSADGPPTCRWCGRIAAAYACPECGGRRLRAAVTGARRTAEELGRAFPGVPVRTSGREEVLTTVPGGAGLVVATPGAEPVAEGGYGAVLLLDSWALLTRADLRAGEEALRRWLGAAALARPAGAGGRVVVVADGALAPVQALLRWDAAWFAARELAERRELGFPPAVRMASVTGLADAVADLLAEARLPEEAELLGPVPADGDRERMLVRVPRARAAALAGALHSAAGVRAARKAADPVRLQVDPLTMF